MLEKIGLPSKPSMRGGNWVVDASHCQGCSSQFNFIHRKHHCRRCGGLFCNNCTNQRMVLRGQGDSPVRICDPCKKLEDAARFEMRYGHKNRSAKGTSKQMQKPGEEIIQEILETESKQESHTDMISDLLRNSSTASSSSSINEELSIDSEACSPEKLRQQAAEEKNKYKILKGQGKSNEALQAFKRSKELERQAGALELALRKKSRAVSKLSDSSSVKKDELEGLFTDKKKLMPQKGKEEKKDIMAELRELGWSDADIIATEKKQANLSIEGELSNLIKEVPKSDSSMKKESSVDKSQVNALKRNALKLKREGKLAEAKEELKKAKILEKQIEEQELLGEDEESDDELSALIKSMNDDKLDEPFSNNMQIPNINLDHVMNVGDDITLDDNFNVTDNDLNDPELAAALKSFGWDEEDDEESTPSDHMSSFKKAKLLEEESVKHRHVKSKLEIQRELLATKKKALALRREGRLEEADAELQKGIVLEQQLEEISIMPKKSIPKMPLDLNKDEVEAEVTDQDMHDPAMMSVLKNLGWNDNEEDDESESANMQSYSKIQKNSSQLPRRSKAEIQRDLLALKRKALNLRRQGKTEEADEELEKAKVLEEQLSNMEASSHNNIEPSVPKYNSEDLPKVHGTDTKTNIAVENEASVDSSPEQTKKEKVLTHKRKALALKREGKLTEAKEELRQAKLLENSLDSSVDHVVKSQAKLIENSLDFSVDNVAKSEAVTSATTQGTRTDQQTEKKPISSRDRFKMQQQSLAHKRNALKLRREGKIEESEAEFELAKALESQLEEVSSSQEIKREESKDVIVGDLLDPELMSALKSIGWQDSDMSAQPSTKIDMKVDMKVDVDEGEKRHLEEMIKAEKIKALNLKREGKQVEALEALRSAKRMEKKLASMT